MAMGNDGTGESKYEKTMVFCSTIVMMVYSMIVINHGIFCCQAGNMMEYIYIWFN